MVIRQHFITFTVLFLLGLVACERNTEYPPTFGIRWAIEGEATLFSSPRAVDVNRDGVKDIITAWGSEFGSFDAEIGGEVAAVDGRDGTLIWTYPTVHQMVGSASVLYIDSDRVPDIVIGGRDKELVALSGADGTLLWSFDPGQREDVLFFNFYTSQVIEDVDGDGIDELVAANGGMFTAQPYQSPRPPGHVLVLSGATGQILSLVRTPDAAETYMSPVVYRKQDDGPQYVLVGTGGETLAGGLWELPLDELVAGTPENWSLLVTSVTSKGVIGVPSVVDLNLDGVRDVVAVPHDARTIAIDGATGGILWQVDPVTKSSAYVTPAIGYFDGDNVPDVFVSYLTGNFPTRAGDRFNGSRQLLIDGSTGEVRWELVQNERYTWYAPMAVNLDSDRDDEIIYGLTLRSYLQPANEFQLLDVARVLDPTTMDSIQLPDLPGTLQAAPLITDLDGDGLLEMIVASSRAKAVLGESPSWVLQRRNLSASSGRAVSWGGYPGTFGDAIFRPRR